MAKNPYIHPEFSRVTAIRLSKSSTVPLAFKVEQNDLVDGTLWQAGAPLATRQLVPRVLGADEKVSLRVEVASQGMVGVMWPGWEKDCFAPLFLGLGTYCPVDRTDDTGTIPAGRRLYWLPAPGQALPPETGLDISVTGRGDLSWSSRGLFSGYSIKPATAVNQELHVLLLTRPNEGGRIIVPACGGQPATELKL